MNAKNVSVCLTRLAVVAVVSMSAASAASNEPENSTPQQVFDGMRQSFLAAKAKGVHARYQWELSGPNGGAWWIDVNDGTFKMGRGKIDTPSGTVLTSDNDWVAMSYGTPTCTWGFVTGRSKCRGA